MEHVTITFIGYPLPEIRGPYQRLTHLPIDGDVADAQSRVSLAALPHSALIFTHPDNQTLMESFLSCADISTRPSYGLLERVAANSPPWNLLIPPTAEISARSAYNNLHRIEWGGLDAYVITRSRYAMDKTFKVPSPQEFARLHEHTRR